MSKKEYNKISSKKTKINSNKRKLLQILNNNKGMGVLK